jgi:hypothetical protein
MYGKEMGEDRGTDGEGHKWGQNILAQGFQIL